eukprot:COSAG01_NODE_49219_length_374_cov_0.680000_1_plen_35_part_01
MRAQPLLCLLLAAWLHEWLNLRLNQVQNERSAPRY